MANEELYDKDFDPYMDLQILQAEAANIRATLNKLIMSHNEHANTLHDLSEQFVKITEQNLNLHNMMKDLLDQLEESDEDLDDE